MTPWRDSIDTIKHGTNLSKWYTAYRKLPYNVFRLPSCYSFDLEQVRNEINNITSKIPFLNAPKDSSGKLIKCYSGLGFYSRKNSNCPLQDHFIRKDRSRGIVWSTDLHLSKQLPELVEDDFTQETEILTDVFRHEFSKFHSTITKASILNLKSKGWLAAHVDFPYYQGIRLHASISGCSNAWYEVDGEKFQIPEDGNWYFIDTGKFHSVWNYGPEDRVTLNINLLCPGDPYYLSIRNQL